MHPGTGRGPGGRGGLAGCCCPAAAQLLPRVRQEAALWAELVQKLHVACHFLGRFDRPGWGGVCVCVVCGVRCMYGYGVCLVRWGASGGVASYSTLPLRLCAPRHGVHRFSPLIATGTTAQDGQQLGSERVGRPYLVGAAGAGERTDKAHNLVVPERPRPWTGLAASGPKTGMGKPCLPCLLR